MVIGVDTSCVVCGEPVRSCVLPAYCFNCDPNYKRLREEIEAKEKSARLNEKPTIASDNSHKE